MDHRQYRDYGGTRKVVTPSSISRQKSHNSAYSSGSRESDHSVELRKTFYVDFRHTDSVRSLKTLKGGYDEQKSLIDLPNDRAFVNNRIALAARFLSDYYDGRGAVFSLYCDKKSDMDEANEDDLAVSVRESMAFAYEYDVSPMRISLHKLRFSLLWSTVRIIAVVFLFLESCFGQPGDNARYGVFYDIRWRITLVLISLLIICVSEFWVWSFLRYGTGSTLQRPASRPHYMKWKTFIKIFATIFVIETLFVSNLDPHGVVWSGAFKPIILFQMYPQARDGLHALLQIAPIASKVIFMELIIISMFAAIATSLYSTYEAFSHFEKSFISMFECKYVKKILPLSIRVELSSFSISIDSVYNCR